MNLSEVLTGATALVVAMLVAHNESGAALDASGQGVFGHHASGPWASGPLASGQLASTKFAAAHAATLQTATLQTAAAQTVAVQIARVQTTIANGAVDRPALAVAPPQLTYGRARMIHAPTPCDVPTFSEGGPGAPYFVADGLPRVGEPFRVGWATKPTNPGEQPAWPAMLLVSFDLSAPTSLAAMGAPGCHLLVQPDYIMMPKPGSILTQLGGCISLDWTPRPSLAGFTFYSQLLVSAPAVNTGGFLVSPVLHLEVGT